VRQFVVSWLFITEILMISYALKISLLFFHRAKGAQDDQAPAWHARTLVLIAALLSELIGRVAQSGALADRAVAVVALRAEAVVPNARAAHTCVPVAHDGAGESQLCHDAREVRVARLALFVRAAQRFAQSFGLDGRVAGLFLVPPEFQRATQRQGALRESQVFFRGEPVRPLLELPGALAGDKCGLAALLGADLDPHSPERDAPLLHFDRWARARVCPGARPHLWDAFRLRPGSCCPWERGTLARVRSILECDEVRCPTQLQECVQQLRSVARAIPWQALREPAARRLLAQLCRPS
jgi:hypothetical protein